MSWQDVFTAAPGAVAALAIGNFDGVHIGHQEVLRALAVASRAAGAQAAVLVPDPHPLKVLGGRLAILTPLAERGRLLARGGAEHPGTGPAGEARRDGEAQLVDHPSPGERGVQPGAALEQHRAEPAREQVAQHDVRGDTPPAANVPPAARGDPPGGAGSVPSRTCKATLA